MIDKQEAPKGAGKRLLIIIMAIFLSFQLIQVDQLNPAYDKKDEIKVPSNVMTIFKRACYDCHSNETVWPWYGKIAPISWSVGRHVRYGRAYVNFSIWETYTQEQKDLKLEQIYRTMYKAMPPASYVNWHDEAKVSKEDIKLIRDWTGKEPY
ncbi:MAG: cytochrome C [Epsilonproteobacteria bacterium]|nr:MAG: cytochrome C [Campylobacterota bacterium]